MSASLANPGCSTYHVEASLDTQNVVGGIKTVEDLLDLVLLLRTHPVSTRLRACRNFC